MPVRKIVFFAAIGLVVLICAAMSYLAIGFSSNTLAVKLIQATGITILVGFVMVIISFCIEEQIK